jgi:D-threo-aldose 1-dehydrogenase
VKQHFTYKESLDGPAALPSLGLGCAAIGNLYAAVSDADVAGVFSAALASGLRYFDTAPFYGHGLSEARLGAFLRATPGDFTVSSKVGRGLAQGEAPGETGFVGAACARPYFDYSRDGVLAQVEASLGRLGRAHLDIAFVHDIGAMTHAEAHPAKLAEALQGAFPALADLKAEGVVGAVGVGVNEVAICLDLIDRVELDVILLAGRYTLLEQAPLDDLLPLCAARGIAVVVGGPYNSGILAGGGQYDYAAAPAHIARRVAEIEETCLSFGVPLAAAALQFPLGHPAVVSVIPGARTAAEVQSNAAYAAHDIPADLWDALKLRGLIRADAPVPGWEG